MSDGVSIPRSFSGQIGVSDSLPSIRRHYFTIPLLYPKNNSTTGIMFGSDSNTTGIPFLQRNATFEKLYVSTFQGTTINTKTTFLKMQVFKNGVSTVFDLAIANSTTIGERYYSGSTTPVITNLLSTDRISVRVPVRNQATKLTAVLVFRERADS